MEEKLVSHSACWINRQISWFTFLGKKPTSLMYTKMWQFFTLTEDPSLSGCTNFVPQHRNKFVLVTKLKVSLLSIKVMELQHQFQPQHYIPLVSHHNPKLVQLLLNHETVSKKIHNEHGTSLMVPLSKVLVNLRAPWRTTLLSFSSTWLSMCLLWHPCYTYLSS